MKKYKDQLLITGIIALCLFGESIINYITNLLFN